MNENRNTIFDYIIKVWPIIAIVLSLVAQWAIFGVRIASLEDRQNRQGTAIVSLQASVADVQTQYAALNAKLDALGDNVLYIRTRIDAQR